MMRNLICLLAVLGFVLSLPATAGTTQAETAVLAVIVSRNQAMRPLTVTDISLIYWRKKLYWADGKRMQPVNFPTDHPLRRQFSQQVLGSLPEAQTEYWNGLYYHGTSPPHVVVSQEAMLRFVAETPGAIGYVDACKVDSRIRVLLWMGADGLARTTPPSSQECDSQ